MAGVLAATRCASGIPVRPRAVQQADTPMTGPMESLETTRHGRAASCPSRARRGCARGCAPLKRWLLFPCAAAQPVFDGHRRESRFAAKY